jgi:hypothetical protein
MSPPAASESNEVLSFHDVPFHVTAPPFQSVPTQNVADGQDSELIPPPAASTGSAADQRCPLYTYTLPAQSPAAQNDDEEQDTDWSEDPLESTAADDQEDPSQTCASPAPSTATQNVVEAQDTDVSPIPASFVEDQREPSQVYALPPVSTATHQVADVQDTEFSSSLIAAAPTGAGADHDVPSNVSASLPYWSTAMQNVADGHDTERRFPRDTRPDAGASGPDETRADDVNGARMWLYSYGVCLT